MNAKLTPPLPVNLLPPDLDCYIAGGYAACPERATDIDVWVKADSYEERHAVRRRVLSWLAAHGFSFETQENSELNESPDYMAHVLKIAVVPHAARLPIHLMVTVNDPLTLMRYFDISTHMVAWDGEQEIRRPGFTTELEEEPYAWMDTPRTPARLEKIRTRYADLRTNGKG